MSTCAALLASYLTGVQISDLKKSTIYARFVSGEVVMGNTSNSQGLRVQAWHPLANCSGALSAWHQRVNNREGWCHSMFR